jgi:ubiquinone/menaquinone biosynthesis C-methylase UbiE
VNVCYYYSSQSVVAFNHLMPDKFTLEQIREFWAEQAREHGQAPSASWSDRMVMELEVREISERLSDGDHVLDVGCANGFSTMRFAAHRRVRIRGVDYIPEMIEQARSSLAAFPGRLRGEVHFAQGDAMALPEPSETYDKVVAIRVIINLGEWARQALALHECARVLKAGGTLLLSEATVQGWQRLNQFRREWGLPDIPMPPFNQYLDEKQVIEATAGELNLVDVVNFASTYYVGTRVLKPLLNQALGGIVDVANPNMEWNRWLSQLPAWGDYGTQKLFVFQKR